ncbi:MAG TPA: hypothetical protein VLE53_08095 [Gemmatimonadaceae bacterium]|nr:hypothetical protein [Gemmatimonadaceae bacterium]
MRSREGRWRAVGLAAIAGLATTGPPAASQGDPARAGAGATLDAVEIRRENVFDQAETSNWLARAANSVHIVTREWVIARELLIRPGEPFDSVTAAETERNLRKLGIFRDVSIDSVRSDSGLVARVTTHDAWTTQINTSFKAGGDQITWGVGLTEKNLLGAQFKATVRYTSDPDRSTIRFGASLPRLWWNELGITALYDELSDGRHARLLADAPFTSLSDRRAISFDLQYNDGDVLRFFEGESEASDTLRHLMTKAIVAHGWAPRASPEGYLRVHTTLQFRREDFAPLPVEPLERSMFGEVEVSIEASRSRFTVVRGYQNLGGPEDIDLSSTMRVGVWLAPSAWGYERTGIGPVLTLQTGRRFPLGFVKAMLRGSALFNRTGLDSGSVTTGVVLALQPAARHSIVLNGDVGWQDDPYPGEEFDLGLDFGPRGFPLHAFTGDRAFFTTGEYRWVAATDLYGLAAIGLAVFADYGGAWYAGSPRRTGADAGVGLRFGSIRSSSGKAATRVDLAHRFANDVLDDEWVIAVGTGFPFTIGR